MQASILRPAWRVSVHEHHADSRADIKQPLAVIVGENDDQEKCISKRAESASSFVEVIVVSVDRAVGYLGGGPLQVQAAPAARRRHTWRRRQQLVHMHRTLGPPGEIHSFVQPSSTAGSSVWSTSKSCALSSQCRAGGKRLRSRAGGQEPATPLVGAAGQGS
jgi:hypothetical protein